MSGISDRWGQTPTAEWLESPYLSRVAARIAHQYGLGADDVPDLLQEIRIALWSMGPETLVGAAWVFQVASHKASDFLRRQVRARHRDRLVAGSRERPTHDVELQHLLRARVARLPTRLREFYELHYRQGLSEREIAQRLSLCRSSVRWLDQCCRRQITGAALRVRGPHASPSTNVRRKSISPAAAARTTGY
jgi:RNA polymerase sigma factor (sigma-70 family)